LENQGDILKRVKKIEKALEGNEKGAAKCEEKTTVPLSLKILHTINDKCKVNIFLYVNVFY
jgi:hypothetical protein